MEGRTTASFRCPCPDVAAPARHSFWVELVGLAGFPAVLHGRCFRCGDIVKRFILGRSRFVEGICGPVVDTVRATWELEDLSAEEAQEAEELTQRVIA